MLGSPVKTLTGWAVTVYDGGVIAAEVYAPTRDQVLEDAARYDRSRGMEEALIDVRDLLKTVGRVDAGSIVAREVDLALGGTLFDEDGEGEPSNVVMLR